MPPLIVTGASGRIGRLVRLQGLDLNTQGFSGIWTSRAGGDGLLCWDLMSGAVPDFPVGGILLHLAGILPGKAQAMGDNVGMAHAIVRADQTKTFAHVITVSTVAVYAPQSAAISEEVVADPQSDYGRSKLAAERVLQQGLGGRLTILRLANLAGADALLGGNPGGLPTVLDPVDGGATGPVRSYIGPVTFAGVLGHLLGRLGSGDVLPGVLNIAQPGSVGMADVLNASGRDWHFGPPRGGVVPKVVVDVARLAALCPLAEVTAAGLLAELHGLKGKWP